MTINRRRAPSSKISSEKKRKGHKNEDIFASLINGEVIKGTQKGDVKDRNEKLHSVKSGKKWQIFLYSYSRISQSLNLNILKYCQDSFPSDYQTYLSDREKCIAFKENYIKTNGRTAAKSLSNEEVSKNIGKNLYESSKYFLKDNTLKVCDTLKDKTKLRNFYNEALFNNDEVDYLTIKDNQNISDNLFLIFDKNDVLNILVESTFVSTSKAGNVPEDFNVDGQKVLICYKQASGKSKNIIEIEVRNESESKYRSIRFNMYSKDTLSLLNNLNSIKLNDNIIVYGEAIPKFNL